MSNPTETLAKNLNDGYLRFVINHEEVERKYSKFQEDEGGELVYLHYKEIDNYMENAFENFWENFNQLFYNDTELFIKFLTQEHRDISIFEDYLEENKENFKWLNTEELETFNKIKNEYWDDEE